MADQLRPPPRCTRCGSETGVSFTGDGLCFACHADATAIDVEPVDEFSVMALAQLIFAQMQQEGTEGSAFAFVSEGLRMAGALHLHAPEMMRRIALWYGDEDNRSGEELSRVAGEWARAVTDGGRLLRAAAAKMDAQEPTDAV